ncbi:creatininase family protein [soil metagenome]
MILIPIFFLSNLIFAQDIPSRWDEITASDWPLAMERSSQTIILPFGILEKHGSHAPMGSDNIHVREWAARATQREYTVVFPVYFFGQVFEAKLQPGTFALPSKLALELLEATCEEMGRNGFKRIVIINGHGGNPQLIRYFVQSQMEKKRDYVVYFFDPATDPVLTERVSKIRKTDPAGDQHGGENETSTLLYLTPELVKMDRAAQESGENLRRWAIPNVYTGIWWYASYPHHYAGEGAKASKELGEVLTEHRVNSLVEALRAIKADTKALEL